VTRFKAELYIKIANNKSFSTHF